MRTVYAQKNKKIILGRQGEDKAVRVVWPGIVSDWSSLYGDGSFQLSVRRFGDENAYPVAVEVNGDDIRFTVTSAETAIAGSGKCELTYIANGTIAKSATWETVVLNSLTGQTPSEPPEEPAKSWFTSIQGQIGNLSNLATASKDNLVSAINEAAQSGGGGGSSVALDTTLTQSGKAADAKAVGDALANKQDTISDLEAIRTGAANGATALQSVPSTYRTASEQDTIDSGKVDKVTGKGLSSNDYTDAAKAKVDALTPVATSGSYNDLTNKPTIPTALPSPNALTFTGAVTGSYDGSAPLSVEIPSGGGSGSDISLGLTGATVGQIAKITAVDSNGKPTSWQAVDMPSGGGGASYRSWSNVWTLAVAEDIAGFTASNIDLDGKSEIMIVFISDSTVSRTMANGRLRINGVDAGKVLFNSLQLKKDSHSFVIIGRADVGIEYTTMQATAEYQTYPWQGEVKIVHSMVSGTGSIIQWTAGSTIEITQASATLGQGVTIEIYVR